MSFILDALKKSETDRQQQGSAEFADIPTSSRREGPPRWLWILGALLAVNLVVLLGLLLRPDMSGTVDIAAPAAEGPAVAGTDFAEQLAVAKQNPPPRAEQQASVETPPPIETQTPVVTVASTPRGTTTSAPGNAAVLPTIHEVRANGTLTLPDLHVDIHVYSDIAEDRFVFINMNKHNEGSRLAEGPLVEEITPDGVVLKQNGLSFLLPRD